MSYPTTYRPAAGTNGLAVASLVLGILSWCVLPFIGAIAAVVCGHMARREIRRAPPEFPVDGDGLAIAGLVLGYAQLLLCVLAMLFFIAVIALGLSVFSWH